MTLPRRIVVDDLDDRVKYSGQGWFLDQGSLDNVGTHGHPWKHTSHGTNNNGSLSFSFEGTSIYLVGTMQLTRIDNGARWDPSWECFVNGTNISSTKPVESIENNWTLCQHTTLNDGPHTLTVNVTTLGKTFWVDKLAYEPSTTASFNEEVFTIDTDDPSLLSDSTWEGRESGISKTSTKGAQARFNFVGKSVTWFGDIPKQPDSPASGSYSIDNGSSIPFKLNGPSVGATDTAHNQIFFTTPDLTPGPHSLLVVYNGGDTDGPATPLTLSALYATLNSNNKSTGTPPPATTSTLPSDAGTPSQHGNPSVSVGAIVGGVVGSLALIAIILFLLLWHRRHSIAAGFTPGAVNPHDALTPFMSTVPRLSQPQAYNVTEHPLIPPSNKSASNFQRMQNSSQNYLSSSSSSSGAGSASNSNHDIRHAHTSTVNAPNVNGVVTQSCVTSTPHPYGRTQANVAVEEIPPTYTAI